MLASTAERRLTPDIGYKQRKQVTWLTETIEPVAVRQCVVYDVVIREETLDRIQFTSPFPLSNPRLDNV